MLEMYTLFIQTHVTAVVKSIWGSSWTCERLHFRLESHCWDSHFLPVYNLNTGFSQGKSSYSLTVISCGKWSLMSEDMKCWKSLIILRKTVPLDGVELVQFCQEDWQFANSLSNPEWKIPSEGLPLESKWVFALLIWWDQDLNLSRCGNIINCLTKEITSAYT